MNDVTRRTLEGAGCVTWWGLSPAGDLLSTGRLRQEGEVRVLLVGSADPRHILKTITGLRDMDTLRIWVIENSMEVVARQLLLLFLALTQRGSMGLHEKTEVFLEVFGNTEIRSQTEETLRHAASQLNVSVSSMLETAPNPCLDTTQLRFKEIDELVCVFRRWTQPASSSSVPIARVWDGRVRHHLGTRYDSRRGCFDWDLAMKLHEKGCGVINKQHYVRWRERGVAFELREGVYQTTNQSLLSTRVFSKGGEKLPVRGYWGDIVSSPYLAFGVETDHQELLLKQNGQHVKTAQDISYANVQALFQCLSSRGRTPAPQPGTETAPEASLPTETHHKPNINELIHLDGVSVTFLPLDSLSKLPEKQSFFQFFNTIYFAASMVHHLAPTLTKIAAPEAVLVVELAKYLLDLTKEQEAGFAERVGVMAEEAGFEPTQTGQRDVYATFTLRQRD